MKIPVRVFPVIMTADRHLVNVNLHLFILPFNEINAVCDYTCATCTSTENNCISCIAGSLRTLSSNQCLCNLGYFDNGKSTGASKPNHLA